MATDVGIGVDHDPRELVELERELEARGAPRHGAAVPHPRRPLAVVVAVLLLLLVGAGLRAVRLDEPGLEQYPTRQYNSALLARKYEQALGGHAGGFSPTVVKAAAPAEIEPPIMEAVTAVAGPVSGNEALGMPRVPTIVARYNDVK